VAASAKGQWASRGPGGLEQTWVGPLGSAQLDRICFFEFIFNAKQFQKNLENV
jgi:hypothetical protein